MYRFKEIRHQQNLTQEQIANLLKISRASYTNIENGKRDPDTSTLISLSRIFHVSIDYLVGLSETEKVPRESAALENLLSNDERLLMDSYRALTLEGREKVLAYVSDISVLYASEKNQTFPPLSSMK